MSNNSKEFVWTDELVREFVEYMHDQRPTKEVIWTAIAQEEFKSSKSSKGVDFEILEFRNTFEKDRIWRILDDGKYRYVDDPEMLGHPTFELAEMMSDGFTSVKNGTLEIYKVKRLSDGVEFKVGDEVVWDWVHSLYQYFTIEGFEIISDGSLRIKMNLCPSQDFTTLNNANLKHRPLPLKKVLFTTEDGVEVYAGMNSWYIGDDFKVKETFPLIESDNNKNKLKHFSTKEKAEEYVLMNSPTLSVNDILNKAYSYKVVGNIDYFTFSHRDLKQLAKSKIK